MNESLTVAVDEGAFTSFLLSTPSAPEKSDVYSNWIQVYSTTIFSQAPSTGSQVSGFDTHAASDPLKLLWMYVLTSVFFLFILSLCGYLYHRRLKHLRDPKIRALNDLGAQGGEVVPMDEDYVVWGLEGMVSTVSSRSEHPIAANSADGEDDDVFKSYTLEMNRRKRSDFFIL